jgi:hypothetical protein
MKQSNNQYRNRFYKKNTNSLFLLVFLAFFQLSFSAGTVSTNKTNSHIFNLNEKFVDILSTLQNNPGFDTIFSEGIETVYDTVMVYDTIFVYDTVYVYETIYEYDTIYVYETINEDSLIAEQESVTNTNSIAEEISLSVDSNIVENTIPEKIDSLFVEKTDSLFVEKNSNDNEDTLSKVVLKRVEMLEGQISDRKETIDDIQKNRAIEYVNDFGSSEIIDGNDGWGWDKTLNTNNIPYYENMDADTLLYENYNLNIKWSVDLYFAPFIFSDVLSSQAKYNDIVNLKKEAVSQRINYSFGANINCNLNNWELQSGVAYSNLQENFDYVIRTLHIDTTESYEYEYGGYFEYDTLWFVNIDTLIATGDTLWVPHINSSWIETVDSTLITDIDTIVFQHPNEILNRYSYLEIPLIFGYSINREKFSYILKGGIITGIFLNAKGKTFSLQSDNTVTDLTDELNFMKLNFTLYFSVGIIYKMSNNLNLLVEPFYRKSINSMFDNYPISNKHRSYGIKIGMRFHF